LKKKRYKRTVTVLVRQCLEGASTHFALIQKDVLSRNLDQN